MRFPLKQLGSAFVCGILIWVIPISAWAQPVFTGDASADFAGPFPPHINLRVIEDPGPDVGIPPNDNVEVPPGTISGWDIKDVYFAYDSFTDILYVGLDCYKICGDADDENGPGQAGIWLQLIEGNDYPHLDETETLAVLLDTDLDYEFDVAVGVAHSKNYSDFGIFTYSGGGSISLISSPGSGFGSSLPNRTTLFAEPSETQPDIEFVIFDFSTLPGDDDPLSLETLTFFGSFQDAGIGEEIVHTLVALPVELAHFSAEAEGEEVLLTWQTTLENGNAGFEIEHTNPWGTTRTMDFIPGRGTATEAQTYSYRTGRLLPGTHRFQLTQVDFDGQKNPVQSVEVTIGLIDDYVLESAYPNPFQTSTTIRFAVQDEQHINLTLYDVLGRPVRRLYDGVVIGNQTQTVQIDGEDLPQGTYVARLRGDHFEKTRIITRLR